MEPISQLPPEGPQIREPVVVQLDPECLQSALQEFFEPLRANDPRADFFAVYRKESDEFDRECTRKYDEDLNTSLIFAGLFSAVSSAFIIDVQSKLESDPNDMTAAYIRILVHTMNASLFPDAITDATTWAGPPPEIVTVQSLLYASLTTSLFAAFLAMLGKQWVDRYLRNRGGSAVGKSRDRQRKLDGLKSWRFQLVIESLPVMLQLALLLLGCALSLYLWTISRTVAGVIIAVTLFGVASYIFFTLAATFVYSCPYQTPLSLVIRRLLPHHHTAPVPPATPPVATSHSPRNQFHRFLRRFRAGVWGALSTLGCTTNLQPEMEDIPQATVTPPIRIFDDVPLGLGSYQADTRCIAWVLHSTTDTDVIFSTVRFAADLIWYPEIAGVLSPHILADLFSDCLLDRQVIPGRAEQASSIGMALASVVGTQLSVEPEKDDLKGLCERVIHHTTLLPSFVSAFEGTFESIASVLNFVAQTPVPMPDGGPLGICMSAPPINLSGTFKVWLTRVILQTMWRWRRVQHQITIIDPRWVVAKCRSMMDGGPVPTAFKTIWILILVTCLGVTLDIHDLYPPNDDSLFAALDVLRDRLVAVIREGHIQPTTISSLLSVLDTLDLPQVVNFQEACVLSLPRILNSRYPEDLRYSMASSVVVFLGKQLGSPFAERFHHIHSAVLRPLLDFLLLSERFYSTESPPYPGVIALRVILMGTGGGDFDPMILPTLTSTLLPTHPLQSRRLALEIFQQSNLGWFSTHAEAFTSMERAKLVEVVGDPFQFSPDLPPRDGQLNATADYNPISSMALLIEFAGSDLWRDHLRPSNFAFCEEVTSTEMGRSHIFQGMFEWTMNSRTEHLGSATKVVSALRCLTGIECWNTAEVLILWAWTGGFVYAADNDVWEVIGGEIQKFYRVRGMERLGGLSRHIKDHPAEGPLLSGLFKADRQNTSRRVAGVQRPVRIHVGQGGVNGINWMDAQKISVACQLGRLYQLFGTEWKAIAAENPDREPSGSNDLEGEGQPMPSAHFV